MKRFHPTAAILTLIVMLFGSAGMGVATLHAQKRATAMSSDINQGGVGRQGDGQPVRVMVTKNGAPVAGAAVVVSVSDGSVILRGVTKATGIFVTNALDQGLYTVTATKVKATGTSPVTIVQSANAAIVSLSLQ